MDVVADNDIILKLSRFGLLKELLGENPSRLGILGAARYVVLKKLRKSTPNENIQNAVDTFEQFLEDIEILEPSSEEQLMAADFELLAQRNGVSLDSGESQLCAIVISRSLSVLLTGDKRAISAIQQLLHFDARLQLLSGKVRCLEQLILGSVTDHNFSRYRALICEDVGVDKTLSICFSCSSDSAIFVNVTECLNSYIADLRSQAHQVLAA